MKGRSETGVRCGIAASLGLLCAAAALALAGAAHGLAAPRYGETMIVKVVSGSAQAAVPGQTRFAPIEGEELLPIGTIVNANRGRVRLTSAKTRGAGVQTADFFSGTFRVLQPSDGRPITVLKLENIVVCPARTMGRGLWGSGEGNYRTVGKHGSATVRGTIWWAQDTCGGTLFRVKRGVVTITVFSTGRTLKLHAGQRYLAPNG